MREKLKLKSTELRSSVKENLFPKLTSAISTESLKSLNYNSSTAEIKVMYKRLKIREMLLLTKF
jgi:hypothetical protein